MIENTKYFWKIVAKDNNSGVTEGPIWSFTTKDGGSGSGTPCPGTPTVYDPRNGGKTYNTVQIGDQCWFKENLDVGTMGFQQTANDTIEKYCYDNDEANCDTYGGLYEWDEAMQYVTNEGVQGICPSGWHIPTLAEFKALETHVYNNALKLIDLSQSMQYYTPTNETGFSALFAGYYYTAGSFRNLENHTYFLSSTEKGSNAIGMDLSYSDSSVNFYTDYKSRGFSVRCLKDY